jgi:hypothetical protein
LAGLGGTINMKPYIDVTRLKRNTELLIETKHTVYEIVVLGPKSGMMSIHGGRRFIRPTKVKFRGSVQVNGENTMTANYIEGDKSMCFSWTDDSGDHDMFTEMVVSARVTASDKSWYYDVIEKSKEKPNEDSNKA